MADRCSKGSDKTVTSFYSLRAPEHQSACWMVEQHLIPLTPTPCGYQGLCIIISAAFWKQQSVKHTQFTQWLTRWAEMRKCHLLYVQMSVAPQMPVRRLSESVHHLILIVSRFPLWPHLFTPTLSVAFQKYNNKHFCQYIICTTVGNFEYIRSLTPKKSCSSRHHY